ncbi:MAG: endoglucanase [Polyangiaceae bacterium]|nr:endoglucanase [Polyangiaceae bacterium]
MSTRCTSLRTFRPHRPSGLILGLALWALACSSSTSSESEEGSGGSVATTGGMSSGGTQGSTAMTGGVSSGGTATGGFTANTGGAATGGLTGTGGTTTGGVETGGLSTGGAATGGASENTGGVATGGRAIGGRSAGGRSAGGASSDTGGSSTGGVETGGRSAGGSSTGGADTGGRSAGGSSTGGADTGGADTGGSTGTGGQSGGYCTAGEPCRISPLGDSITEGINMAGAYRIELFRLATEAGKDITFVGTRSNGPNEQIAGKQFPKAHEGTSGISVEGLQQQVVEAGKLSREDVDPNIILLHIGTNNMYGSHPSPPEQLLPKLLDAIIAECPDALLVVAQIIPYSGVDSYNAAIPGIVQQRAQAGAHIIMVDQNTGFPNSELADGVHPNQAGYERMGKVWYDAIKEYLP